MMKMCLVLSVLVKLILILLVTANMSCFNRVEEVQISLQFSHVGYVKNICDRAFKLQANGDLTAKI